MPLPYNAPWEPQSNENIRLTAVRFMLYTNTGGPPPA